jgi:GH15 family glucan-1,4-alpha-glucosidase
VRYGVRRADDPAIIDSLPEIDDMGLAPGDQRRIKFEFSGCPAFRRYSFDRYGERHTDGIKQRDDDDNRGRPWPFLTGERGHYELERLKAQGGGTISAAQITDLVRLASTCRPWSTLRGLHAARTDLLMVLATTGHTLSRARARAARHLSLGLTPNM